MQRTLKALLNIWKLPDLRKRLFFTLLILVVYRIGAFVPTPGIDGQKLSLFFSKLAQEQGGTIFGIMNMFSGGAIHRLTIFALGIMPYVSASIIMQLLTVVIPHFERLSKEGELGRKKLIQYTRYGTIGLALMQSFFIALWLESPGHFGGFQIVANPGWAFRLLTVLTLTTGTAFIMWLGEQIQERGVGNGTSLIIAAGILSRVPTGVYQLVTMMVPGRGETRQLDPLIGAVMIAIMVAAIVAVIMLTQGERKIPVQYAKRIVGRKVVGGQSTYIPFKVNQGGVIPIIFAQSLILFPATVAVFLPNSLIRDIAQRIHPGGIGYSAVYVLFIVFFCYFYAAISFNPIEVAENMKKYGGFIPGVRPGKPTADFFDYIINRITLPGGFFLALIAVFPDLVTKFLKIPFTVADFFGGTALLIVVGVALDTMKQLESQLIMHQYEGFMRRGKIRGRFA